MITKKSLNTLTGSCLLAAAAALQAPAASAIPINITSITSFWSAANPADAVDGVGTNTISWGRPDTDAGPSSYVFDSAPVPIDGVLPDSPFELGEFTHNNFPIFAPFLSTAELSVEFTFDVLDSVGGSVVGTEMITSFFDFTHLETRNTANPCADGGANGVGVNINGCADRVTFSSSNRSQVFVIDGITYAFSLTGFVDPVSMEVLDQFWTTENLSNSASLFAEYRIADVPAPGAAWLLMTGLAGVAAARRARRPAKS